MRLKERGQIVTLSRGEVAEWLNAAVSKTVTSAIPASGVRIPPSPRLGASQHGAFGALSAHFGLRPRLSASQLLPFQPQPAAHDEPLAAAVEFCVLDEVTKRLAEVLRSDSRRLERAEMLTSSKRV